jgi:hypothetical protein
LPVSPIGLLLTLTRQTETVKEVTISVNASATVGVVRRVAGRVSVAATTTVTLAARAIFRRVLAPVATGAVAVVRLIAKGVRPAPTGAVSVRKRVGRGIAAETTTSASVAFLLVIVQAIEVVAGTTATLAARAAFRRTIAVTASAVATVVRRVGKIVAPIASETVLMRRLIAKEIDTITSSATTATRRTVIQFPQLLVASLTVQPDVARVISRRVVTDVVATSASISRRFNKILVTVNALTTLIARALNSLSLRHAHATSTWTLRVTVETTWDFADMSTMTIERGNVAIISVVFRLHDGTIAPVSGVWARVRYKSRLTDDMVEDILNLAVSGDVWSAQWDSENAAGGPVDWYVQSTGAYKAADEGVFMVLANAANRPGP